MARRATSGAVEILRGRYVGRDSRRAAALAAERAKADVAQAVYDLRMKEGVSQRELSLRIGTTQSVIRKLEDADYEGHSLLMLCRIAAACGKRLSVGFVEVGGKS